MKEILNQKLANPSQTPYSKGGDIFMAEPGNGENSPQKPDAFRPTGEGSNVDAATRRLEEQAARQREQRRAETPQTAGAGNRGGDGGIPSAPPIPEEPEGEDGGSEQTSEVNKGDTSSVSDTVSREEFIGLANQALNKLNTLEFKLILARARSTQPQYMPELHSELSLAYTKLHDSLFIQRVNLQPKDPNIPMSADALREQARIDGLLNNLQQERDQIADLLISQIRYREDPRMNQLADVINSNYKRLSETAEGSDDRKALEEGIRKAAFSLYTILEESEDLSPENHPIPDKVLRAIGKDEFATEKFMGRLLAAYQEEDQFQVRGLYGGVNLDVFLKVNQDITPERMNRLQNLIEGSKAFHNMNFIIKRSFDNFVEQSKVLLPRHFEVIGEIPGVRDVFLAYESLTNEELGIETRVLEPTAERIEREIRTVFKKKWAEKSLNISGFAGPSEMQEWEIDRALTYGRNLFKTSVRAAEIISQSELSPDEEKFVSQPQKELTQLMHTFRYIVFKFKPNEPRGGFEIAQEVLEGFRNKRRDGGKVNIKTLGGTDVDMGTLQTIISPRGVFATWRMSRALLKEIKFENKDGAITDVTQFFEDNAKEIERLRDLGGNDGIGWTIEYRRINDRNPKNEKELREWKKTKVRELFSPLLEGNTVALGVLVSGNGLTVPTELKEIIWEKIAEFNPGAMASLLTRLEVDEEAKGKESLAGVEALEDILLRVWGGKAPYEEGYDPKKDLYVLLRGKTKEDSQGHEINPKEEIEALEKNLDGFRRKEADGTITKKEKENMENLNKELSARKIELKGGRLGQLRKAIHDAEEKLKILEGKRSKQKGRVSMKDAETIESTSRDVDKMRKEYVQVDEQLKLLLRNENWKRLKDKIRTANTLRLRDEVVRIRAMREGEKVDGPKSPESYLTAQNLTDSEKEVIDAIAKSGKIIASDLANIKKSTTWFLDDVPLEIMKWTNLGQFYDRETNDLANFSKAAQELLKVVAGDPFSMPPEEILKIIRAAMGGAGDVLGLDVAQENMEPVLTQYLSMIYEFPKDRQIIKSALKHGAKKPTSRAQEITGSVESPAINEDTMFGLMEKAKHMGAYRSKVVDKATGKVKFKSTIEEAEKKFGLEWYKRFIWANARDYGPFFLIAFIIQFFRDLSKESFSDK